MGSMHSSINRYRVETYISEIHKFCPKNVIDITGTLIISSSLQSNAQKGIVKLSGIVACFTHITIRPDEGRDLLVSSLYFVYCSWENLTIAFDKKGKQTRLKYAEIKHLFKSVVELVVSYAGTMVVDITMEFFSTFRLWYSRIFVVDVLRILLDCKLSTNYIILTIFDDVEKNLSNDVNFSIELLHTTYSILQYNEWYKMKEIECMTFIVRLRDMFRSSMSSVLKNYSLLRRGLNVCLKQVCIQLNKNDLLLFVGRMINSVFVSKLTENDVLEFVTILEFAAGLRTTKEYNELEQENIFLSTLELMRSQNSFLSLSGCRLLQYLLDRHGNSKNLSSPLVFFEYSELGIHVSKLQLNDVEFINKYKEAMFDSIIYVIMHHSEKLTNIGGLFACITLVSLEVPCGLTAAWTAWVAIKIQEHALHAPSLSCANRHSLHALTISVLSVVCWVHNAKTLYKHIGQVAAKRANQAPHLCPPLRYYYKYSQYHVTWDKPDLFIDEWELRYGLWTTFNVLNKKKVSKRISNKIKASSRLSFSNDYSQMRSDHRPTLNLDSTGLFDTEFANIVK